MAPSPSQTPLLRQTLLLRGVGWRLLLAAAIGAALAWLWRWAVLTGAA